MDFDEEYDRNLHAYRLLRGVIDQSYPAGRLVALYGGQVVADAATPEELLQLLQDQGKDPLKSLVVEAGDDTPDYMDILAQESS